MEQKQLLRDSSIEPTAAVIAECLGMSNDAFVKFSKGIEDFDVSFMGWRYYNDGKAWLNKGEHRYVTRRGTMKATPLFWLSIWEGFFKVSFFFGANLQEELLSLPLSKETKKIIENAHPMGKTARFTAVIIDVTREDQLKDIYELAKFRKIKVK
jgi:hypothetical protein